MEEELESGFMIFRSCFKLIQTNVKCFGSGYLSLWRIQMR